MRGVVVLAVLLLAACGGEPGSGDPEPIDTPLPGSEVSAPDDAEDDKGAKSITGTFGGSRQLEGGCAWIEDGRTKWEVEWPAGYTVSFDPLTLTGPDGKVAGEGDTLMVNGKPVTDAVTICQVGPLWRATEVTAKGR
jgi:hypothetical protein